VHMTIGLMGYIGPPILVSQADNPLPDSPI